MGQGAREMICSGVGGGGDMEGTWWAHGGHAWGKEC